MSDSVAKEGMKRQAKGGRRRGHGEGSISKHPKGWQGQITLPDSGGKRKSVYGKTRKEVQEKIAKLLADVGQGLPVGDKTAVGPFLTEWLRQTKRPNLKRRTYLEYEYIIDHHLIPAIGRTALHKLTTQDLQRLYTAKLDQSLSPTRVRHIHAVIRGALTHAVKCQMVARNVAQMVTLPKIERKDVQVLTPEQARALLAEAKGTRYEAIFTLALATGMRQGELLGLRWQDVDLDAGLLQVRSTLANHKEQRWLDTPKTHRSKRPIPLGQSTIDALKAHRARQIEERLAAGSDWQNADDLVFTTTKGTPVAAAHLVNRDFKPLLREAGLPDVKFHALRHTTATLLMGANERTKLIQDYLGHSQASVTLDIYSHTSATMLAETAATMDRLLSAG